jgi:hypothetical protein
MAWAQFKKKWARYSGKENSAYQEHFNDLCRLLGHPTPSETDLIARQRQALCQADHLFQTLLHRAFIISE